MRRLLSDLMISILVVGSGLTPAAGQTTAPIPAPIDYTVNPTIHQDEVNNGPRRIISIAPSISETCAALGMADRLVGRTQYCTHPPSLQRAAVIGAYADTNYEKIIALKPDLILITDRSPKIEEKLKALRLAYETLPDNTLKDVFQAIHKLGRICNRPRSAEMLVDHLQTDLERLSERSGDHRATRVLFTFHPLPLQAKATYMAGPGSHLDNLLQMAGYSNALKGLVQTEWPMVSVETIVAAKPDYILEVRPPDKTVDMDKLYQGWSSLSSVPAFRYRRVRSLQNSAAVKPGPRVNIVLHEIITTLAHSD